MAPEDSATFSHPLCHRASSIREAANQPHIGLAGFKNKMFEGSFSLLRAAQTWHSTIPSHTYTHTLGSPISIHPYLTNSHFAFARTADF